MVSSREQLSQFTDGILIYLSQLFRGSFSSLLPASLLLGPIKQFPPAPALMFGGRFIAVIRWAARQLWTQAQAITDVHRERVGNPQSAYLWTTVSQSRPADRHQEGRVTWRLHSSHSDPADGRTNAVRGGKASVQHD